MSNKEKPTVSIVNNTITFRVPGDDLRKSIGEKIGALQQEYTGLCEAMSELLEDKESAVSAMVALQSKEQLSNGALASLGALANRAADTLDELTRLQRIGQRIVSDINYILAEEDLKRYGA